MKVCTQTFSIAPKCFMIATNAVYAEAVRIIEQFLTANPNYPDNLKNKVLSASWILMKQVPYVPRVNTPAKKATPAKATATKATATKATKKKTTKKK